MSLVEDAAAALSAAVEGIDGAVVGVMTGRERTQSMFEMLSAAMEGSTRPEAESAVAMVAEAVIAQEQAVAALERGAQALREYAIEVLGVALGSGSAVSGAPAVSSRGDPAHSADPAEPGPLGERFAVGVHDPEGLFLAKERSIADRLAQEGACVHPRRADHTVYRRTNPDAVVRWTPDDGGTITEFKTLLPGPADSRTVRNTIMVAGKQLRQHGGGDLVIDCRATSLDLAEARRGHARALGQARVTGQYVPRRVLLLLRPDDLFEVKET